MTGGMGGEQRDAATLSMQTDQGGEDWQGQMTLCWQDSWAKTSGRYFPPIRPCEILHPDMAWKTTYCDWTTDRRIIIYPLVDVKESKIIANKIALRLFLPGHSSHSSLRQMAVASRKEARPIVVSNVFAPQGCNLRLAVVVAIFAGLLAQAFYLATNL